MPVRDRGSRPGARPEDEILLCCARVAEHPRPTAEYPRSAAEYPRPAAEYSQPAADRTERLRALLQQDVDWAYLFATAKRHGMQPLLYWGLNSCCPEAVPPTFLDQLRDHFQNNAQHNLVLTRELLRLLDLFEAHQIPAIPFKGPVLAHSVYGNLALRQFGDLDILVHRRDLPKAGDLLASAGYSSQFDLPSTQELETRRLGQWLFIERDRLVELHWQLLPRYFGFPLDLEPLWQRLAPVPLAGREVMTFAPEDLLLILCVHGAKHMWERLAWICDVVMLVGAHKGMDWDRLISWARSLGGERMLLLGLFLADDLLGADLPLAIRQRARADPAVRSLAAQVQQWLFAEAAGPPSSTSKFPFHIRARERWGDRLRYVFYKTVIPSVEDADAMSLPPAFSFLYYPLRPFRLLVKYGQARFQSRETRQEE